MPTSAHRQRTTPFELWFGRKPDIRHLRTFGCVAYSHIPNQLRQKLDEKAETMLFVGYSLTSKGYRLYRPSTNKIVISRDVVFNEERLGVPEIDHPADEMKVDPSPTSLTETEQPTADCQEASPEPRRSGRIIHPPKRYGKDEYVCQGVDHVAYITMCVKPLLTKQLSHNTVQESIWWQTF